MYVRFVVHQRNESSHRREGLFGAAADLRDGRVLSDAELAELEEVRHWFNVHLKRPSRFSRSRRSGAHSEAICWFKDSARQHIRRMRQMADILERQGIATMMLTAGRPGYIVYEDSYQVAAVPFRDTRA